MLELLALLGRGVLHGPGPQLGGRSGSSLGFFEPVRFLWRAIKGRDTPLPPTVRRAIAYRPADPK